jgi:hypothetical protein
MLAGHAEIAVVVRTGLRDHVARVSPANPALGDLEFLAEAHASRISRIDSTTRAWSASASAG